MVIRCAAWLARSRVLLDLNDQLLGRSIALGIGKPLKKCTIKLRYNKIINKKILAHNLKYIMSFVTENCLYVKIESPYINNKFFYKTQMAL